MVDRRRHLPIPSLVLALGIAALAACDPGGWKLVHNPSERTLRSVFVESKIRAVMAGSEGTVLVYDGDTVTDTSTNADMPFRVPDFYGVISSGGRASVAGDRGIVLTRAPSAWTLDDSRTTDRLLTMLLPTASTYYAAGEHGRVIRRTGGQTRWENVDVNAPADAKITSGWGISARTIVFATDRGVVIELVDRDWISQTVATRTASVPLPLFGVWSSTRGADLFAVGLGGTIFRREARKTEWTLEETPVSQDIYSVFGTASDRIFAVGARGTILRYDGIAWAGVPSGTSNDLFSVHGTSDGSFTIAVGAHGTIVLLEEN